MGGVSNTSEAIAPPSSAATAHREGVARNAFWLVVGQAITTALAIVLSAALGRRLGAADFGVYYLITSIATFVFVFVDWGPPQVVRDVARSPADAGRWLGATVIWRTATPFLAGAFAIGIAWALGYPARTLALGAVLIAAMTPLGLARAHGLVFRAVERMDDDATVTVSAKILTVAVALPSLALGGGLGSVIAAQGAAAVVALVIGAAIYRRRRLPRLTVDLATVRALFWGGLPILTMSLAAYGQTYVDSLVLARLASPRSVGWYAAARNFIGTLIAPATILATASYPRLSRLAADPEAFRVEVRAALRPILVLGMLAGVGTWLFADLAIGLVFGRAHFSPAIAILRLSAPVIFLYFVDVLLGMAIMAAGRERRFSAVKVAAVVIGTVLDILLVPWCEARFGNGGLGVELAEIAAETVMGAAALAIIPHGTVNRHVLGDVARTLAAGAGALLAGEGLSSLHPAIGLPLAVGVYAALVYALGLVSRDDLALIVATVRRRRGGARTAAAPPGERGGSA